MLGPMEVRLRGLDGPVEMIRDRYGVPHCRAVSEHDAFFAQGFMHAVDRLWQMDYDRRRGLGRAAEVTGQAGITGDTLYRRLGLAAAVQRDLPALSAAARDMLGAYASGVNALIGMSRAGDVMRGWRVPAEFGLTGQPPELWEPWHSLLVFRVRHMTMGSAAPKLWRAVVAEALGPAAARRASAAKPRCRPGPGWTTAAATTGRSRAAGPRPGCRCWPATRTGRWKCRTSTSRGTWPALSGMCSASACQACRASRTSATTTGWR